MKKANEKLYHQTLVKIYDLMNKGENNLSDKEIEELRLMATAAEKYEDEVLGLETQFKPKISV